MGFSQGKRPSFKSAARWSYVTTWGQQGISGIAMFVLAAFLGPSYFGLVAIAMVYIAFLEMFVIQGYTSAIIQRKDLEAKHLDALFWFIMASSVVFTIISILLSRWWASLNDASELPPIIAALSLLIPIRALTVVQQAILQREMQFKYLAIRANVASIVGGSAGLGLAFAGFGVWSLVGLHLVRHITGLFLLWKLSDWRPRLRFRFADAKDLIVFSLKGFSGGLFTFGWRNGEVMLIGLFFGPAAVGLYRLANRAVELLLNLLTRSLQVVSLPYFSPSQDNPDELQDKFTKCVRLAGALTLPAVGLLVALAPDLLRVLGEDWQAAVGPLRILSLYVVLQTYSLFIGIALVAVGKPHVEASLMAVLGTANVLCTTGAAYLARDSSVFVQISAVAWSRVGVMSFLYVPLKVYSGRRILSGITARGWLEAIFPSLATGIVCMVVAGLMGQMDLLAPLALVPSIFVRLAVAGAIGLLMLYATEPLIRKAYSDGREVVRTAVRRLYATRS